MSLAPKDEIIPSSDNLSAIDEWMPNLEELRKELEEKTNE
jgi:hypothetical protein